jgi:hypothetical protein
MLNKTGNEPPQRAQIARRGPRQGTREQGNKKTGQHIARRQGLVQQRAVILSEFEGSAVAFEDAGAMKERTRSK